MMIELDKYLGLNHYLESHDKLIIVGVKVY